MDNEIRVAPLLDLGHAERREAWVAVLIEFDDGARGTAIGRAEVQIEKATKEYSILFLQLKEGRKREVKHLCKAVGHPVIKLIRIEFAGIECGRLKPGQWRQLTGREVSDLRKLVAL